MPQSNLGQVSHGSDPRRQHYWDVMRGFLMVLGVPYHAALIYHDRIGWAVSSPDSSHILSIFSDKTHIFRMPLFFVVAGYFAAMTLVRRAPWHWAKARLMRLGVPLLCGIVILSPIQVFLVELGRQGVGPYDLGQAVAAGIRDLEAPTRIWIRHLWFLLVLIYFNTAAAFFSAAFPSVAKARLDGIRAGQPLLLLVVIGIGLFMGLYKVAAHIVLGRMNIAHGFAEEILNLPRAVEFLPYFVLGGVMQRSRPLLTRFTTFSLTLAAGCLAAFVLGRVAPRLSLLSEPMAAVLVGQMLLSIARSWFDHPIRLVEQMVRASFVIYLFHMPIVQLFGVVMLRYDITPIIEWGSIVSMTFAITYGIFWVVVRNPWLNWAFNGVVMRRRSAQLQPA